MLTVQPSSYYIFALQKKDEYVDPRAVIICWILKREIKSEDEVQTCRKLHVTKISWNIREIMLSLVTCSDML